MLFDLSAFPPLFRELQSRGIFLWQAIEELVKLILGEDETFDTCSAAGPWSPSAPRESPDTFLLWISQEREALQALWATCAVSAAQESSSSCSRWNLLCISFCSLSYCSAAEQELLHPLAAPFRYLWVLVKLVKSSPGIFQAEHTQLPQPGSVAAVLWPQRESIILGKSVRRSEKKNEKQFLTCCSWYCEHVECVLEICLL